METPAYMEIIRALRAKVAEVKSREALLKDELAQTLHVIMGYKESFPRLEKKLAQAEKDHEFGRQRWYKGIENWEKVYAEAESREVEYRKVLTATLKILHSWGIKCNPHTHMELCHNIQKAMGMRDDPWKKSSGPAKSAEEEEVLKESLREILDGYFDGIGNSAIGEVQSVIDEVRKNS